MFWADEEVLVLLLVFAIPIVAVSGWLVAGVVRTISSHRLVEAAVRERIALIARGVDPERLRAAGTYGPLHMDPVAYDRHRAQGLLVWGLALTAGGVTLAVVAGTLDAWTEGDWPLGVLAAAVGVALLAGSAIVWPRGRH